MASSRVSPTAADLREKLMHASHILHHHDILDGFGHISVRNPEDPKTCFLTGTAAALITSPDVFTEYQISDGQPVKDGVFVSPYSEHHIHAAILAKFPGVHSVVHSHALDVLAYTVTSGSANQGQTAISTLRPIIHKAGFLGESVPVWDIASAYTSEHERQKRHLLVNDYYLGESLAAAAAKPSGQYLYHKVVLQRGHGFVALGDSIEEAVYNAIYTVENARVQAQAEQRSNVHSHQPIHFLSPEELEACATMDRACITKVWPLWMAEIKRNPLWQ
ncbi:class II aldolase/adducin domain-containing protein [Cladophialophora carrionii]|uniref:Class II aldolase/adducin domain-containing protein n=1 Tax=Cladophialophora carrionii TaxID=86049 RepID=A0A1C1CFB3_9EURO|nr:class II aldolase/adducin domain-containing protein [Cladophialophora carrionii]